MYLSLASHTGFIYAVIASLVRHAVTVLCVSRRLIELSAVLGTFSELFSLLFDFCLPFFVGNLSAKRRLNAISPYVVSLMFLCAKVNLRVL